EAGRVRGDEEDVVLIGRAEDAGTPGEVPAPATESGFPGSRHDLVQRRIPAHRVRQFARRGGIGASELDGGRGAAALAVAAVGIDLVREIHGQAGSRVEALEYLL